MLAVSDGMMFTNADSVRTALQGFWSAPWLKSLKLTSNVERIYVLSPTAAVMTTRSTTEVDSAGKKVTVHNLWTSVWQNRRGRWVVVQQHSSSVLGRRLTQEIG
jgi:ketosteroid isomerase-like protein